MSTVDVAGLCKSLGMEEGEMREQVLSRMVDALLHGVVEDGPFSESGIASEVSKQVQGRIDELVKAALEREVLPRVDDLVENAVLRETNRWGEPKGEPVTFKEYLVSAAERYLTELVDFQGKPKGRDSYNWQGKQTRVAHMVHEHLHYSIQSALKKTIADGNKVLVDGIQKTIEENLRQVSARLSVDVKTDVKR